MRQLNGATAHFSIRHPLLSINYVFQPQRKECILKIKSLYVHIHTNIPFSKTQNNHCSLNSILEFVWLKCWKNTHLLILKFNSNYSKCVAGRVVIDVDSAEALLSRLYWHPFLTGIVINHNWCPGLAYTLFTEK